ncbi:MAG: PhoU domain-containing protein [Dehalococcoidales bacterium]
MFRALASLRKSESFMRAIVGKFGEMLAKDEWLFCQAWATIDGAPDLDKVRQPFYDEDRAVNAIEQDIRRMLVEHLSVHPAPDIPGTLVLMSLVKDAERIGDYSKNIFELGIMLRGVKMPLMKYYDRLAATRDQLVENFPLLRQAFAESDETLAGTVLKSYGTIKNTCNGILKDLVDDDLPTKEAVASALLSRYLKRVSSHISNIASGLTNPLDQIDFVRGSILE